MNFNWRSLQSHQGRSMSELSWCDGEEGIQRFAEIGMLVWIFQVWAAPHCRGDPLPQGTEQIEKHIVKGVSRGVILCNVAVTVGDAALEMGSLFSWGDGIPEKQRSGTQPPSQEGGDIYVLTADSHSYTAETRTAL